MSTCNIQLPHDQLTQFCQRWKVRELALFGSVLRDDFRPDSDIDILVTFAPEAKRGVFVLAQMQEELETLFGRSVDLVRCQNPARSPLIPLKKDDFRSGSLLFKEG